MKSDSEHAFFQLLHDYRLTQEKKNQQQTVTKHENLHTPKYKPAKITELQSSLVFIIITIYIVFIITSIKSVSKDVQNIFLLLLSNRIIYEFCQENRKIPNMLHFDICILLCPYMFSSPWR